MSPSLPTPIMPPDNFPVNWQSPEDARLTWTLDRIHMAEPTTPMVASVRAHYMASRVRAWQHYGRPFADERWLRINTYMYSATVPLAAAREELAARAEAGLRRAEAAVARLDELWEHDYFPEIQQYLAAWDRFDLEAARLLELVAHLHESVTRMTRLWEIHFLMQWVLARSQFEELYCDLFGSESGLDAYGLLLGFDNKSLQTGRALWHLSRMALAEPAVRQVLTQHDAALVLPMLESVGEAEDFRAGLRTFLNDYGRRFDSWDWSHPSWLEAPAPVISLIQRHMTREAYEPEAELESLAGERERLIAEARARLRDYPEPVIAQFEMLLKSAQVATVLLEDHNFYIDFQGAYYMRRVLLEFGRRLAEAGSISQATDVMYLTLDELLETVNAQPFTDRRALAAERRAEMAYWRGVIPPSRLGSLPNTPPLADPLSRSVAKFFGTPVRGTDEPGTLHGHPGSSGSVRAPAKVVHSLADASKLQNGDVLVTVATAPPWTPLFAIASAVVTDAGGVLSHCALVAREYRIPAVVGTGNATQRIHDGQLIEVDGSAGVVRLLD